MMKNAASTLAKRPQLLKRVIAFALLAACVTLAMAGCASKPVKQPETIKEFLSQPRPQ